MSQTLFGATLFKKNYRDGPVGKKMRGDWKEKISPAIGEMEGDKSFQSSGSDPTSNQPKPERARAGHRAALPLDPLGCLRTGI